MTPDHAVEILLRAHDLIDAQNKEIADLKRANTEMQLATEFLRRYAVAVNSHNMNCEATCGQGADCGYEGYLKRTGRRCITCPVLFKVDVMPHKGSA